MATDLLALTIDRPAVGGPMIARSGGRVVLVSGAIPGERVLARVDRVAKNVAFASTVRVEDPSPHRRPAFDDPACGGCAYSHIAYPRQLEIKGEVVADAFARIGRLELPAPVHVRGSPERGYRMRARLHVRGGRLGFFREGTHQICDARQSHQLLPETCETLDRLMTVGRSLGDVIREVEISENIPATERVAHLETSQPIEPRVVRGILGIDGLTRGPHVTDLLSAGGHALRLRRHVLAFFQGNRYLLPEFVTHVAACVPVGTGVLDLYAGTGLFSVAAAALRQASVIAVEGDRFAADDLHANAAAAGGFTTSRGDVESFLSGFGTTVRRPASEPAIETVIVDPPRTGLSREALVGISSLACSRLIYVSCDVATLARDSRRFVEAGYRIERADGFDLFPNTPHVETVVVFQR